MRILMGAQSPCEITTIPEGVGFYCVRRALLGSLQTGSPFVASVLRSSQAVTRITDSGSYGIGTDLKEAENH